MVLGLLAIGAFAVYTVWDDVQPRRVRKVTTGQMQMIGTMDYPNDMDSTRGRTEDLIAGMIPPANTGSLLLIRSNDQVLLSEPAQLPHPAGGERVTGFTRVDGHVAEEYAIWNISGQTAQQVQQNYADAAISKGFSKLKTSGTSQTKAINQVYVRSPQLNGDGNLTPPGEEVLVIRTRTTSDKQVKLLLWFKYPKSQDMP